MKIKRLSMILAFAFLTLPNVKPLHAQAQAQGAKLYADNCAYCHGADGKGSRGPAIATMPHTIALSDAALLSVLQNGQGSMPSFPDQSAEELNSIVRYLRTLQRGTGPAPTTALPGDPAAGKTLFYGDAHCSNCHMVSGQGGFMAPDLTAYGQGHGAEDIGKAITSPNAQLSAASRVVEVQTRGGEKLSGLVRNEDNLSLTLQTRDGRYHFLTRSNLTTVNYTDHSLMPADYATRLTQKQIADIESFLILSGRNAPSDGPPQGRRRRAN